MGNTPARKVGRSCSFFVVIHEPAADAAFFAGLGALRIGAVIAFVRRVEIRDPFRNIAGDVFDAGA